MWLHSLLPIISIWHQSFGDEILCKTRWCQVFSRLSSKKMITPFIDSDFHNQNTISYTTYIHGCVCLYIYIYIYRYIHIYVPVCVCVCVVWFYGISTIEGSFNAIAFLFIYIKYLISKHILLITILYKPELIFFTHLNGFTYFCLIQMILFTIYQFNAFNYCYVSLQFN